MQRSLQNFFQKSKLKEKQKFIQKFYLHLDLQDLLNYTYPIQSLYKLFWGLVNSKYI